MSEISHNAHVQSLYREVNERIALVNARWDEPTVEVLCECGATGCAERIELAISEYESLRTHSRRFVLLPGHEDDHVEQVVRTTDGYLVVENFGVAAEIAERTDPRTGSRSIDAR